MRAQTLKDLNNLRCDEYAKLLTLIKCVQNAFKLIIFAPLRYLTITNEGKFRQMKNECFVNMPGYFIPIK